MIRPRRRHLAQGPGKSTPLPAPGELEVVQAFVNTVPTDRTADSLSSPATLSRWLQNRGLLPQGTELAEQDLGRALAAREALRALLTAKMSGAVDLEATERLAQAAGEACCRPRFDDAGPVGLAPASANLDGALGAILAAYALGRARDDWHRFRLCACRGCRRAFYDGTRSRRARWCTPRCGNRSRARAYRRYHKRP